MFDTRPGDRRSEQHSLSFPRGLSLLGRLSFPGWPSGPVESLEPVEPSEPEELLGPVDIPEPGLVDIPEPAWWKCPSRDSSTCRNRAIFVALSAVGRTLYRESRATLYRESRETARETQGPVSDIGGDHGNVRFPRWIEHGTEGPTPRLSICVSDASAKNRWSTPTTFATPSPALTRWRAPPTTSGTRPGGASEAQPGNTV